MRNNTIRIDKAGRVVLPKPLRKQFNLLPGDKLRLSTDETGIKLEPADVQGKLVKKGSVLVFTGEFSEPVTSESIERMIEEDRARGGAEISAKLRRR